MKAKTPDVVKRFEDIPNVGPCTASDFRQLGIQDPKALVFCDAYVLFERLCQVTRKTHDPCMIDVFLSAISFMKGEPAKPWWEFTPLRKAYLAKKST